MNQKRKLVFNDTSGKRFYRVKSVFFISTGLLILFSTLAFSSIWIGAEGKLPDHETKSPFDIIDNISTQVKDKISTQGEGSFVKITKNSAKYQLQRYGASDEKKIVITFDDGPHPTYTPQILKILKEEGVPATFFLTGQGAFNYPEVVRDIHRSGMEIGNHTFSHKDENFADYENHKNSANMDFELNFTQNLLQSYTGVKTSLFRVPYWGTENDISSNALGQTTFALDKGYVVSTPNLDSSDWEMIPPEQIVFNSTRPSPGTTVLLLHDGGGNRANTVLALKRIIDHYQNAGYEFTTLSGLLGQELVTPISFWERTYSSLSVWSYWLLKNIKFLLNPIFIFGLVFSLSYALLTVILSFIAVIKTAILKRRLKKSYRPKVAILIPAFNEEEVIAKTIESVLQSNYTKLEVVVIDDGSTDQTYKIAKSFTSDERVRVFHKKNGGKFSALNFGLKKISSPIYLSVDADTQLKPATIGKIIRFFQFKNIGAVGGNVRVGNRRNLLGILQGVEYTSSLNLERNAFSLLNSILVIPGALGAWRTQAVRKVGGYSGSTLTEDAELTMRMLKHGYRLHYDSEAVAYTEAPQTVNALVRQRFRWTYGILQTFYLHRAILFSREHKYLGMLVLPFNVFVQLPLMVLTPIMDVLAIGYLFFVSLPTVAIYTLLYIYLRTLISSLAFVIGREGPWPLLFVPLSRFFYQPALYIALYLVIFKILQGSHVGWGKLARYNSVTLKH